MMDVVLSEQDRVVLWYEDPSDEKIDIIVVHEYDQESYCALWKAEDAHAYQLGWRGNFDKVVEWVTGLVGDREADYFHTLAQKAHDRMAEQTDKV
jgi:hypothetical protein